MDVVQQNMEVQVEVEVEESNNVWMEQKRRYNELMKYTEVEKKCSYFPDSN